MSHRALLRSVRFAPLFWTQFLGAFNDNVYKNALVILIAFRGAELAGMNNTQLVIAAAGLFILPFFLFSATAGQLADRFDKDWLIRRVKLLEIGIMSLAALGFLLDSIPFLLLVLALMGLQSALFGPLKYGILPQHLNAEELMMGNGLVQMGTFVAILLGTILGGVLIAQGSSGYAATAVLVILVALLGWRRSQAIPVARAGDASLRVDINILRQTLRVMGHARENRSVFLSILGISWFWFVGASFLSLMPSYGRDVLGGNEYLVTLLLTLFSLGIGSGSVSCGRLSRGRVESGLVPIGALGISLFGVDLYFASLAVAAQGGAGLGLAEFLGSTAGWRVCLDLLMLSFSGGLYIVPLYALVQSRSAIQARARVIAANNVVNALLMVLSALTTFVLNAMGYSIAEIFLSVAVLNVLATGTLFVLMPEFLRGLRSA